jgi:hypothetical protein
VTSLLTLSVGELIESLKPLFALAKKHFTVIMPPLPRYVFFGCCMDRFHSTNVREEGYSPQILEATLHFRKLVKTSLVGNEDLGQFWVTDTLACLGTMPEKMNLLRASFGPDGVHLTDIGRMHFFNNLAKVILEMKSGTLGRPPKPAVAAASSTVTGKTYYWRGFVSDRGSVSSPAVHRGRGRGGRGGQPGQPGTGRGDLHTGGGRGRARPTPYQRSGPPGGGNGKNCISN